MKKLFLTILFTLVLSGGASADLIELTKCHKDKYENWDSFFLQQELDIIDDHTITINFSNNTITQTLLRSKENVKKLNDTLTKYGDEKILKKITQSVYEITTYTNTMVTGRLIEKIDPLTSKNLASDSTIYVNLETGGFDRLTRTFNSKTMEQILPDQETSYLCDNYERHSTDQSSSSSGTAFFVNNRGYLLTNNHVVDECKIVNINYKDKDYDTQLVATDKTLDLALLKANVRPKSFINFSDKNPKKLQKIYVAGYPFGKGLSDDLKISSGIVSSLKGFEDDSNEIQIDAPINPGNSGGPIINDNGELIAIAVSGLAKDQTEGINFGIKSSAAEIFLKSNNIIIKKSLNSKIKNSDQLLEILESSTVYIYCNL